MSEQGEPHYQKDHPAMLDSKWATTVHAYYGSEPYRRGRADVLVEERGDMRIGESVADSPASPERENVKL